MFSQQVRNFLEGRGDVYVTSLRGSRYKVRLEGNEVKLLDRPELYPINLELFDVVERIIDRGIVRKGCAREKLGTPNCDDTTIMGRLGYEYYGKEDGDYLDDESCYIFAILNAAGCIYNRRGSVERK